MTLTKRNETMRIDGCIDWEKVVMILPIRIDFGLDSAPRLESPQHGAPRVSRGPQQAETRTKRA